MKTSKNLAAAAVALAGILLAAPPLATIRDTIYKADGTKFNGRAIIEWRSFEASNTSFIGKNRLELQITDGFLNAKLVPTTTAASPAFYQVKFINAGGTIEFLEAWAVKPALETLRVRDVRIADPLLGPGQSLVGPITLDEVEGLEAELNLRVKKGLTFAAGRAAAIGDDGDLEAVVGAPDDCVHVDGSSGPCGGGATISQYLAGSFVDGEIPTGSIDGSNSAFTLSQAPNPVSGLLLYRNGLLQKRTLDYNIAGSTITFESGAIPQSGDVLLASYRTTGTSGTIPQTLCAATGTSTASTTSTSLGTCSIPGSLLRAGDRVEITFDLAHLGNLTAYSFEVRWGATVVATHSAPNASTAGTGRISVGVFDNGSAQWSSQTWGNASAQVVNAGTSTELLTSPVTIDFRGSLATSTTDTVALRNFTVVRIQAP